MISAGDKDLRHGSAALLVLATGMVVWQAGYALFDASDLPVRAASALAAFFPFAIGMGLRRRERWARWLGARLGAGAALMSIGYLAERCVGFYSGDAGDVGALVELTPLPFAGALGAFAAWKLFSPRAREAINLARSRREGTRG